MIPSLRTEALDITYAKHSMNKRQKQALIHLGSNQGVIPGQNVVSVYMAKKFVNAGWAYWVGETVELSPSGQKMFDSLEMMQPFNENGFNMKLSIKNISIEVEIDNEDKSNDNKE